MPANPDLQTRRRAAIADILADNSVATQSKLVAALRAAGYDVTQSSISRDFRIMGVQKTPEGYRLPSSDDTEGQSELAESARFVRTYSAAGANLVVIRTAIGAAQRVALAIDRSDWSEVVGTVSGDDTIFIATSNAANSRNVIRRLEYLTQRSRA